MIPRTVEHDIQEYLASDDHRIFFLWGPRRSGKTTILQKISRERSVPIFDFDYQSTRNLFVPDEIVLKRLVSEHTLLLIDEVQNYPEATVVLKLIVDRFKVKVIATGSSELRQKGAGAFDTLAGRFIERFCLPLSVEEIMRWKAPKSYEAGAYANDFFRQVQMYGAYPEVLLDSTEQGKEERLGTITQAYVLKDIINLYDLKNTKLAHDILVKVALQLGSEVSLRELANSVQANVTTVASYIEIFIKNYVLLPLAAFKTNARRAVSSHRKFYFYDLGIRNSLVGDFRDPAMRPDGGGVFENFILSEMDKIRRMHKKPWSLFFYREYGGKEVDVVLETHRKEYTCFEIKRTAIRTKPVFPIRHELRLIHAGNYHTELARMAEK